MTTRSPGPRAGALLRTEGIDVAADMAAGDPAIATAAALRPDVAVVDVSPVAGTGFGMARRLLALPGPPAVVLTSSAEPAEFGGRLDGHSFVARRPSAPGRFVMPCPGLPAVHPSESSGRRLTVVSAADNYQVREVSG
jgi:CheY-like chemotaxis protein